MGMFVRWMFAIRKLMKKYTFHCPDCDLEVHIDEGTTYRCECGWIGKYPDMREKLELN
jgi:predicted RNA-binding Zn-ribbon protein involved in translation (DUF1610 family)